MVVCAVEHCRKLEKLIINECYSLFRRAPKLIELICEHPNLSYLEGYSYTFMDENELKRLQTKPGLLKIVGDGV